MQDEKQVTDSELIKLGNQSGGALPILRGHDPGLPKNKPVFDLDVLRKRNFEHVIARAKKKVANG